VPPTLASRVRRGVTYWYLRGDAGRDPRTGKRRQTFTLVGTSHAQAVALLQAERARSAPPERVPAEKALDRFLDHWRTVRRVEPVTVEFYDETLRPLFRWLAARGPMEAWEPAWFDEYVASHPEWSPNTIRKRATAMRTFAKWARRARVPCPDIAQDFSGPRATPPTKEAYDLGELRRLLEEAETPGRAIGPAVLFAAWAGLSAGDLERLRPEHVRGGWLTKPRSKTRTALRIPLAGPLRRLVKRLRAEDWPLLPASGTARWRSICRAAGVPSKGGLKRLRHTYSTCLDVCRVDAATHAALMGHAPRSVSDRYRHADLERLTAAIAALERLVRSATPRVARDR
jgi:integrase